MRFASLGSGSKGNATIVCDGHTRVMVDCGFGLKELEKRLLRLRLTPADLSAVLVTHEHADHIRGVGPLARKYRVPVYMTAGTLASNRFGVLPEVRLVEPLQRFSIGDLSVLSVPVVHDAREPSQFVIHSASVKIGILTDLGSITSAVLEAYSHCDGLLVEANHDPVMLACGPYPQSLKTRVSGQWGHLSNAQTASLLAQLDTAQLQQLVVGHISQHNNSLAHTTAALQGVVPGVPIHYACQELGFDWLYIHPQQHPKQQTADRGHTYATQ